MSHYAVAVFANDVDDFEKLLEPYDEGGHMTPHLKNEEELNKDYERFLKVNPGWRKYGFEYYLKQHGYRREDGLIYIDYNENAKWDWYTLNGRDYMFPLKPEAKYDSDDWFHRKNDYDYAKGEYRPYAFVTPDGVWHAPGNVGWFAMSDETEESTAVYRKEWDEYIASADNPYVSFVDCHI